MKFLAGLLLNGGPSFGQTPKLPSPSGERQIGQSSFHWFAAKQPMGETESEGGRPEGGRRDVVVQIWYPAAGPGRNRAPYLPGADALASSAAAATFANLFGPSWRSITSGELLTNAFQNTPVAPGKKLPVLVFSPGGGVPVAAYTAQMEDLASHGYVVAGVNHISDLPAIVLPDGQLIIPEPAPRKPGNEGSNAMKSASVRAADIRFVIDQLHHLNAQKESIYYGRLELARLGVFGHSAGGRAAARACQLDARVKACLNQDGNMFWQPFWLDEQGRSMRQPYMTLDHFDPDPPDEAFRKMGTARDEYVARRSARQAEAREKLYATVEGGSYHVTIKTPGVSHNSFLDIRDLGRSDGSGINAWPENVRSATPNAQILKLISTWTRAFFDETIRQDPKLLSVLERSKENDVEVRRYVPASKR
jgi:hypothetical protein